jgi:hypothetical protein
MTETSARKSPYTYKQQSLFIYHGKRRQKHKQRKRVSQEFHAIPFSRMLEMQPMGEKTTLAWYGTYHTN